MITLELDAFHFSGNRSVWNNQKLRLPLSPHQLQADADALRRISRTGEQAKAKQMAALDDILAFDDAGAADDIDARHARGQHRVRLLGAEANAPALQEAAPWLSWADSAGTPTLPLGEVLLLSGKWLVAPAALAETWDVHRGPWGPHGTLSRTWAKIMAAAAEPCTRTWRPRR